MRSKEKKMYIVFICALVLIVAIFGYGIIRRNKDIDKVKANLNEAEKTISQNETVLEEKNEKIAGLETELQNSKSENEKIKAELNSANTEKDKLKKENGNLKKEIENLKLKKQQSAQSTVKKDPVQTQKPATKPATQKTPAKPSSANKVCYLTFDDGPTARTLEILKILKKYDVKATFFVINTGNFNYIKQIHAEGHAIGLHAYSHNYAKIYANTASYFNDLQALSNKVYATIGVRPNIMRFPGGSSNVISRIYSSGIMTALSKLVTNRGFAYFDWNVDSDDAGSSGSSYTRIINNVLAGANGKNSICVLMHDAAAKTSTVQALPKIIEGLKARGYRFEVLTKDVTGFHHGINN